MLFLPSVPSGLRVVEIGISEARREMVDDSRKGALGLDAFERHARRVSVARNNACTCGDKPTP